MLGKLLNKLRPRSQAGGVAAGATAAPPPAPDHVRALPEVLADWQSRLQAVRDDDDALLILARTAPLHDIRHAAILALRGENALRQAEREFRNHDKRLHRAAKLAHETLVRQREARARAAALIDAARALTRDALLPANRLVELAHSWRALEPTLLDAAQTAEFARVQEELAALARARSERRRQILRWTEQTAGALNDLQAATDGEEPAALAAAQESATTILAARATLPDPDDPACQAAAEELQAALQFAAQTGIRRAEQSARAAQQAEQEQRTRSRNDARQHAEQTTQQARTALAARLNTALDAAEQALAAGRLHDVGKQLAELRDLTHGKPLKPDAGQQNRLHVLQAEHARLKGWQAWGGEQAREELTQQAEALAAAVSGKLDLKQHAHEIEQLRARWKALGRDHLGNAASQALWKRFDAALHAAWQPVAAQQQKLAETRSENLQTREALLATLEATPSPAGEPPGDQATTPLSGDHPGDQASTDLSGQHAEADWRAVARALEQFQAEWRKLGPLEHTVPREAKPAIQARLAAAVARLEAPLKTARRRVHAERSHLIARAIHLQAQADGREVVARVRALQTEWQQHAKAHPLARKEENALWAEFKAATDAIFKARDDAHQARDAELTAHQATRTALIARLTELAQGEPLAPHELKREIAAIETQWRNAGPAPKAVAGTLDAAFRNAHAQALQHAARGKQRLWQTACDALLERLTRCEADAADAADHDAAARAARWDTLPQLPAPLPTAWIDAVRRRYTSDAKSPDVAAIDAFLLRLEAALDIASPPAHQAARRELKLQAMKRALEAREVRHADDIDALIADALAQPRPTPEQSQRLRAVLAARTRHP